MHPVIGAHGRVGAALRGPVAPRGAPARAGPRPGPLRRRPGRRRQRAGRPPGRPGGAAGAPSARRRQLRAGAGGARRWPAPTEGARRLGWSAGGRPRRRAPCCADGRHEEAGLTWELRLGDALDRLDAEPLRADVVFWDPFSPKVNGALWTAGAFSRLAARCAPGAGALHLLHRHRHPRPRCCWPASRSGTATPPAPRRRPPRRRSRRPSRPGRSTPAGWSGWPAPRRPSRPTRPPTRWSGSRPCSSSGRAPDRIAFVPSGRLPPGAGRPSGRRPGSRVAPCGAFAPRARLSVLVSRVDARRGARHRASMALHGAPSPDPASS